MWGIQSLFQIKNGDESFSDTQHDEEKRENGNAITENDILHIFK